MKLRRALSLLLLCSVLLGASDCASIVGKSQHNISITSQPAEAEITIVDEAGSTVYKGKTPTTVTLGTRAGYFKGKDYRVTFAKKGYAEHTVAIRRSVSSWYIFGNLVFGGLIGYLIVDPATGAMWTLQKDVHAELSPLTGAMPGEGGLRIVLLDEVPSSLRPHIKRIE